MRQRDSEGSILEGQRHICIYWSITLLGCRGGFSGLGTTERKGGPRSGNQRGMRGTNKMIRIHTCSIKSLTGPGKPTLTVGWLASPPCRQGHRVQSQNSLKI